MGLTPRLSLPYPELVDSADVPRDVKALADKLDPAATTFLQGAAAVRPAAGVPGRFYFATDTAALTYDTGSAWVAPAPSLPVKAFAQTAVNGGPTFSQTNTVLATLSGVLCSGTGPVLAALSGFLQNDGTNGTSFAHTLVARMDGVNQGGYVAVAKSSVQGTWEPADGSVLIPAPPAGAHTFQLMCGAGTNATWSLRGWQFSVAEL